MDNLTHSLFGVTLARTPLSRAGRGTTAALLLASNAPDLDVIVTLGGPARYLELHRGPTHGPLGVVLLSFTVAVGVWLWERWRHGRRAETVDPPASFLLLWGLGIVGVLGHVLMDLPTSYGTRAISPFSWTWFTLDWMPIVDIYLLAILGGALWFSRGGATPAERIVRRRRNAAIALALMAANYGVRAASHETALARAPVVFGSRLPPWCADRHASPWGVDSWPQAPAAAPALSAAASSPVSDAVQSGAQGLVGSRCLVDLAAMPDFLSPFRWRLIAQLPNAYQVRDLDLLGGGAVDAGEEAAVRISSVRVPNIWTPAVVRAAAAPTAQVFLGFSRFPAARSLASADGATTVRWSDLRFMQGAPNDSRQFRRGLFTATVVVSRDGRIVDDRLGP